MVYHGKKWTQIHNYPEACSADLQWFSPEILEQVSLFFFFKHKNSVKFEDIAFS